MSKSISRILTLVAGLIGIIGFFFFVRILLEGDDNIVADAELQSSIISPFVSFSIIVLVATAIVAVLFSVVNLIKHPQTLKRSLLGVGILAVLLVIAYSFASDEAVTNSIGQILPDGEAGSVSKWVSTGINFSGILGVIGLAFFLVDFVKGLLK